MAFALSGFAFDGGNYNSGIPRIHKYVTADDNAATVDSAQYFNDLASFLKVGDLIMVKSTDKTGFVEVLSNDGTDVDVSDVADDIGDTDTD